MAEPTSARPTFRQRGAWYFKQPGLVYKAFGTGLGASMWFFLFYRAKKDGAVLLGWKHPWDH
ncbi:hypothetical protein B0T26DRAFT_152986 [Lasiosphaeria miniovina]|uniref:NADH dehydrogenase [ubiquinone] 1 beta subcomplex subunit 2 n=1 Tax=Lasiosphaeria miniovina TaxID=1954250 RepID=A0AA40B5D1_9PEZI|nr:uncharacterized protein B0T26DRAFT_152986 [Lasiosphaeria miniovina]KAK0727991.1 hypothetical protein B0T26DRAFT_152986 [Lasiosphaeria miniovina]